MPIFTIAFCAIIFVIYILDNFILIPKTETVTLKEKLWAGHNKGYINHALHLSEKKIKKPDFPDCRNSGDYKINRNKQNKTDCYKPEDEEDSLDYFFCWIFQFFHVQNLSDALKRRAFFQKPPFAFLFFSLREQRPLRRLFHGHLQKGHSQKISVRFRKEENRFL